MINNVYYVSVVAIRFALVGWRQVRLALVDIAHGVCALLVGGGVVGY
ncbi:MAG: hypothetical protein ACFNM7_10980 [Prevotella conceptionensis]